MTYQSNKAKYLREAAEEARVKAECSEYPSAKRIFSNIAENYEACADQWEEAALHRALIAQRT